MNTSPQSLGGRVMAIRQRENAINRYYEKPNFCLNCGGVIRVESHQKVSEVRSKKFCNRSCAAKFNNRKHPKRIAKTSRNCKKCGKEMVIERIESGAYSQKKYCHICIKTVRSNFSLAAVKKRFGDYYSSEDEVKFVNDCTKLELFRKRKNWQSARSAIRRHANFVFSNTGMTCACRICGYDKSVQICHIKPVADFDDSALISEINASENLVALCRNHHWEFDHGMISVNEFRSEKTEEQ